MDYLEFVARVTSHIPDKGQVMVCYSSLYPADFLLTRFVFTLNIGDAAIQRVEI
jgi:hypothetical protein